MKENILDKYALNQLNSEDKQWIKNALAADPSFQQELDLHANLVNALIQEEGKESTEISLRAKISQIDESLDQEGFFDKGMEHDLIKGLQLEGEKELLKTIKTVDQNLEKEDFFKAKKANHSTKFISLFAAAASILFLLSIAWYYSNNATLDYQQEYAAVFESYENTLSNAVQLELSEQGFGGNPDEAALQEILVAMKAYDNKEYDQAVILFPKVLANNLTSSYHKEIQLYLGLSYLELGEQDKAIFNLQNAAMHRGFTAPKNKNEVALWYLALTHLKFKQVETAKLVLNKLKDAKSSPYQKKASALLQKLS